MFLSASRIPREFPPKVLFPRYPHYFHSNLPLSIVHNYCLSFVSFAFNFASVSVSAAGVCLASFYFLAPLRVAISNLQFAPGRHNYFVAIKSLDTAKGKFAQFMPGLLRFVCQEGGRKLRKNNYTAQAIAIRVRTFPPFFCDYLPNSKTRHLMNDYRTHFLFMRWVSRANQIRNNTNQISNDPP